MSTPLIVFTAWAAITALVAVATTIVAGWNDEGEVVGLVLCCTLLWPLIVFLGGAVMPFVGLYELGRWARKQASA